MTLGTHDIRNEPSSRRSDHAVTDLQHKGRESHECHAGKISAGNPGETAGRSRSVKIYRLQSPTSGRDL